MNENEINLAAAVLQLMVAGKCIKAGTPVPMLGAEDYRDIVASRNTGERMKPDKIYLFSNKNGIDDIWYKTKSGILMGKDIEYIRADIHAKLTEQIEDTNRVHRKIMEERCASDEVHCTCVPFLRAEVEKLKAALSQSNAALLVYSKGDHR